MIIQIRGTSGSGKTSVMRKVISVLDWSGLIPVFVDGRRSPLYYVTKESPKFPIVSVLGAYAKGVACGGCDNIHGYDTLIPLVLERAKLGHVLMEGLLLSEDVKQTLTLPIDKLRIIFLNTSLETCLDRVRQRREAKGNTKPLNTRNTSTRVATIERARQRLEAAGVKCQSATGDQAPKLILTWLRNA